MTQEDRDILNEHYHDHPDCLTAENERWNMSKTPPVCQNEAIARIVICHGITAESYHILFYVHESGWYAKVVTIDKERALELAEFFNIEIENY